MFDRLDDMLIHYEEIMQELNEPGVAEDQTRFRKLMTRHFLRESPFRQQSADITPCHLQRFL